jgi:hypothetical protein
MTSGCRIEDLAMAAGPRSNADAGRRKLEEKKARGEEGSGRRSLGEKKPRTVP